ncbi:GGDEF domain-containing protein [Luteimonas sp. A482]
MSGQPLTGIIDLLIVACISVGAVHAWRTGRTDGAATFLAVSYSIGCIGIAHVAGLSGVLWLYPVLVANFLLVRRRPALLMSVVAITGVVLSDPALGTAAHKIGFITTAVVVSLFSFVFASRAAVQRSQLQAIALRDPLTGAGNRRGMEAELEIAIASSVRSGVPMGLLVFDLDNFKQINDSFGHEAGDEVLVQIADVVRASTRMDDRFFRPGGEEFVLLLPGATAGSLREVAEKLRSAVEREVQAQGRTVTISVGATPFHPTDSPGEWLARADAAMYEAKRTGRNRTVVTGLR